MKIYELDKKSEADKLKIKKIVVLHMKAFPDFFLTKLGKGFLSALYQGYFEDSESGIIVAEDKMNELAGFIAYSKDYSNFFKKILKKHMATFVWGAIKAVVGHPSFFKRLWGALKKSDEVKREEQYVELASICVNPEVEGKGIGSELIAYLISIVDLNKYSYISLETDAENNDKVNRFYQKNKFVLVREYTTPERRKMNEYRYSLSKLEETFK